MKTSRVPPKTGSSSAIEPAPRLSAKEQTQAPASVGGACSMPLLQIQTRCPSLLPNLSNRFNAVLSRYTPVIAICK